MKKLNLGAGKDIKDSFINHDIADLTGMDVVHDLNNYPWPWKDATFDLILAVDVLEHLDDFVKAMEEIHRILKFSGLATIRVPYWNHSCAYIDPTHKRGYHERTFDFFDINSNYYKIRSYYSSARFTIINSVFILDIGYPHFSIPRLGLIYVKRSISRKIIGFMGDYIPNIIADIEIVMKKV
jgi:SAM-dependent methyltransferase